MRKSRSKEEKLRLSEDYKVSELSMSKWCAVNGMATFTLSTWSGSTNNETAKFVEVLKTTMVKSLGNNKVTLEYKE